MDEIQIELREHPARAPDPARPGRTLNRVHPAVADWRAVYLLCPDDAEDLHLGYITPEVKTPTQHTPRKFHLVVSKATLGGSSMAQLIRDKVAEVAGLDSPDGPTIADPPQPNDDNGEYIEDEL